MIDPSKNKERWRVDAKRRASEITPERLEELRKKYPDAQASSPTSAKKPRRAAGTFGAMDAVSVPVYGDRGCDPFVTGASNDFLFPVGSGQNYNQDGTVPRQLRQDGWIYLRAGEHLVARVQFKGLEHRESRIEHVPSPDGFEDRGPGMVLAVDPSTWEECSHLLASPSESGNGYRYYMLDGDRPVWTRTGS